MKIMEPIHHRMKRLREKRGLSGVEMAKAIGVPASTYREWEYGRAIRGEPYVKMAEVLRISLYELITGIPPSDAVDKIERMEELLRDLRAQLIRSL